MGTTSQTFSVEPVVRHTSYKWVIMIVAIIMMLFQSISRQGYGLMFAHLLIESSSTKVTWIFNVFQFLGDFISLFGGPLCDEFGQRLVLFVGGAIFSAGIISSAFVVDPDLLYVTFSIMTGLGMGIVVAVTSIKVPEYFLTQQGIATSLLFTGVAMGQLVGPFLVTGTQELVGTFWTILILGTLFTNICPLSILFHPSQDHEIKPEKKSKDNIYMISYGQIQDSSCKLDCEKPVKVDMEDRKFGAPKSTKIQFLQTFKNFIGNFSMLKSPMVIIIITSLSFISIAYSNFLMYIPFAMVNNGFTLEDASLSLTVASLSMVTGRLVMPAIYDLLPIAAEWYFRFGALFMSISIMAFTYIDDLWLSYIALLVFGMTVGCTSSFRTLLCIELVGIDKYPAVYGLNGLQTSLFYLAGASALGVVAQAYEDYIVLIRVLSGIAFIAFLMWLPMPLAKKYDKNRGFPG